MAAEIIVSRKWVPARLQAQIRAWQPGSGLGQVVKACLGMLPPEEARMLLEAIQRSLVIESQLEAATIRHPDNYVPQRLLDVRRGRARDRVYVLQKMRLDRLAARDVDGADLLLPDLIMASQVAGLVDVHGVVSRKVITTAGVGFLVDAWQNLVEMEVQKYHGIGTGATAEATGDTALVTELTTQYNPDNTRATGTLAEGAANIFQTVATNTVDSSVTIAEHGIFSQAATGGGVLWDRSVLSPTSGLGNGDSLQSTYSMTATAGG